MISDPVNEGRRRIRIEELLSLRHPCVLSDKVSPVQALLAGMPGDFLGPVLPKASGARAGDGDGVYGGLSRHIKEVYNENPTYPVGVDGR